MTYEEDWRYTHSKEQGYMDAYLAHSIDKSLWESEDSWTAIGYKQGWLNGMKDRILEDMNNEDQTL